MRRGLQILATGVFGLFTGAMLLIAVAILPYWESLPPLEFRSWFSVNAKFLGAVMVPLAQASVLFSGLQLIAVWKQKGLARVLAIGVVACSTFILLEYVLVHKGFNITLIGTTPMSEIEAAGMLFVWKLWHWVRLILGGTAFAFSLILCSRRA